MRDRTICLCPRGRTSWPKALESSSSESSSAVLEITFFSSKSLQMASYSTFIPDLTSQSPSVDFIPRSTTTWTNITTPPARYDSNTGGFFIYRPEPSSLLPQGPSFVASIASTSRFTIPPYAAWDSIEDEDREDESLVSRPLAQPTEALKFWDSLFSRSMDQLKEDHPSEPDILVKSGCRVRNKEDWTGVFEQLELYKTKCVISTKVSRQKFGRSTGTSASMWLHL